MHGGHAYISGVSFSPRPGEQIVFEGHPSWRAILDFYLKGAAITGVLVAIVWLWGKTIGDGVSTGAVLLVLFAGVGITAIAGFLLRVSTQYAITDQRLHIKRGIISREVEETRLTRVQDVSYTQSLVQRVLRIGDVDFDTASMDNSSFRFAGVDDPNGVVRKVYDAVSSSDSEDDGGLTERRRPPED